MSRILDNISGLVGGIIHDFEAGYSSDKHAQYVTGQYDLALEIKNLLEGLTESMDIRTDQVEKLVSDVVGQFISSGFSVEIKPSQTTNSRYIEIDGGQYPSVRVSDHKCMTDSVLVDIGTHHPKTQRVMKRAKAGLNAGKTYMRFLVAAKDVERLVDYYEELRSQKRLQDRLENPTRPKYSSKTGRSGAYRKQQDLVTYALPD